MNASLISGVSESIIARISRSVCYARQVYAPNQPDLSSKLRHLGQVTAASLKVQLSLAKFSFRGFLAQSGDTSPLSEINFALWIFLMRFPSQWQQQFER
jgi:hypothetical protein